MYVLKEQIGIGRVLCLMMLTGYAVGIGVGTQNLSAATQH